MVCATAFTMLGKVSEARATLMGFAMVVMPILALPALPKFFTWASGSVSEAASGGGLLGTAVGGAVAVAPSAGAGPVPVVSAATAGGERGRARPVHVLGDAAPDRCRPFLRSGRRVRRVRGVGCEGRRRRGSCRRRGGGGSSRGWPPVRRRPATPSPPRWILRGRSEPRRSEPSAGRRSGLGRWTRQQSGRALLLVLGVVSASVTKPPPGTPTSAHTCMRRPGRP